MPDQPHRFHRPQQMPPEQIALYGDTVDPAQVSQIAHETAAILVRTGRASDDPELTTKLVNLVEELGLSTVAELWSRQPAVSLPGALWRLYALREWIRRDPVGVSVDYSDGRTRADVLAAVAGSAEPPSPDAMRALGDAILAGVYDGELDTALDRAAAFCQVVSTGRAHRADLSDGHDEDGARSQTVSASALRTTAVDLARSAAAWRAGKLD